MAEAISGKQTVFLKEALVAQAFEFEAQWNVLESRDLINRIEVLEEIKRLRAQAPEAK